MATVDRIDPGYTSWTPSAAGMTTVPDIAAETYRARHRRADDKRRYWLTSLFYRAKHRAS